MSKKIKKISVNKLESIAQDSTVTFPLSGSEDIEVAVRCVLPLMDVMQFVEDVVSACVDADSGRYIPEARAFAIRANVLTQYANFTLPQNAEKQYDLIYNTDAFQQVFERVDKAQYAEIINAIDERIKHEVAMMESSAAKQVSEVIAKLEQFIESTESMFGSVGSDDLAALVKNLSGVGNIDEGALVKAVLDSRNGDTASVPMGDIVSSRGAMPEGEIVMTRKRKE